MGERMGEGRGAAPVGPGAAVDSGQAQVWEIILPNWFRVRTRNPLKTLKKIFSEDIDMVAIRFPKALGYIYLCSEDLTRLLSGEEVRVTVTTGPPFNRWGICEAWTAVYINRGDFE
ncbi:MAG: hypothetical protein QW555_07875 [Nitrososphaerota archaeon]